MHNLYSGYSHTSQKNPEKNDLVHDLLDPQLSTKLGDFHHLAYAMLSSNNA